MTDTHYIRVEEELLHIRQRLEAVESKCSCKIAFKAEVNNRLYNLERKPKPWRVNVPVVKAEGSLAREVCTGCGEYTYDCKCITPLSPSVMSCNCTRYEDVLKEGKELIRAWMNEFSRGYNVKDLMELDMTSRQYLEKVK